MNTPWNIEWTFEPIPKNIIYSKNHRTFCQREGNFLYVFSYTLREQVRSGMPFYILDYNKASWDTPRDWFGVKHSIYLMDILGFLEQNRKKYPYFLKSNFDVTIKYFSLKKIYKLEENYKNGIKNMLDSFFRMMFKSLGYGEIIDGTSYIKINHVNNEIEVKIKIPTLDSLKRLELVPKQIKTDFSWEVEYELIV